MRHTGRKNSVRSLLDYNYTRYNPMSSDVFLIFQSLTAFTVCNTRKLHTTTQLNAGFGQAKNPDKNE